MEVQGPNSVEVTWQAPPLVHHNGPILSYIFRYFPSHEPDMTQDSHVTADEGEATQRKTLSNLEPFTRYSFRVSAVNTVGAGPFSVAVEEMTKEHGEDVQLQGSYCKQLFNQSINGFEVVGMVKVTKSNLHDFWYRCLVMGLTHFHEVLYRSRLRSLQ